MRIQHSSNGPKGDSFRMKPANAQFFSQEIIDEKDNEHPTQSMSLVLLGPTTFSGPESKTRRSQGASQDCIQVSGLCCYEESPQRANHHPGRELPGGSRQKMCKFSPSLELRS